MTINYLCKNIYMHIVITGIYKISSKVHPDRCYIGSAVSIKKRWDRHRKNLREGKHNPILQNHYNKYGLDDLVFSIIEECPEKVLIEREQFYIDAEPLNCYFNATKIAGGSVLGVKHSKESRERRSKRMMGHPNWNENVVPWNKGLTKDSDERLLAVSKSGAGQFKKGLIPWNKGKKLPSQPKEIVEKRVRAIKEGYNKGRYAWNKGLTKETDERLMNMALKLIEWNKKNKEDKNIL